MFGRLSVWFPSLRSRLSIKKVPGGELPAPTSCIPGAAVGAHPGPDRPVGAAPSAGAQRSVPRGGGRAALSPQLPRPQRGAAAPARPDGGRRDRRRAPTCARSARRRPGAPGRAPAAGAQRGAAGPRKGCGKAPAPPRRPGWFRGSPPAPGPGGPFPHQLPFCGAGEDLRPAEGHGLRSAVRGAPSGGTAALLRARPYPGAPPGSAPAPNGAAGWRGGRRGRRGLGRAPRRRERSAAPG